MTVKECLRKAPGLKRIHQAVLTVSTLLGSWLGMQAVHELGHVTGAWLSGGQVTKVVLHPLTISRTDLVENPHPLFVVWCGPILGVVIPLVLWAIAALLALPGAFVLRFFAAFCLIANGAYISFGSIDRVGDCGTMLQHGSAMWQLWAFGLLTIPLGFWLWHRQGRHFGLAGAQSQVDARVANAVLVGCALLLLLGFVVDGQ
jgi:hypothetical protein